MEWVGSESEKEQIRVVPKVAPKRAPWRKAGIHSDLSCAHKCLCVPCRSIPINCSLILSFVILPSSVRLQCALPPEGQTSRCFLLGALLSGPLKRLHAHETPTWTRNGTAVVPTVITPLLVRTRALRAADTYRAAPVLLEPTLCATIHPLDTS